MAASLIREPHNVPLPASPMTAKQKKISRKEKGKNKEQTKPSQKRRVSAPSETAPDSGLDWDWISLTESSSSKAPPIFTSDGHYFFSLVGSSVKIHSSSTGDVVSTLLAPTTTGDGVESSSTILTCAVLNPHNDFQLVTSSMDGCLRVWDFLEATLLKTVNISLPILSICMHSKFRNVVFVATSRPSKSNSRNDDGAFVIRVSLNNSDPAVPQSSSHTATDVFPIGRIRSPSGIAISPNGQYLVVAAGHKIYVAITSSLKAGFTKYISPERLTCLSFHPSEDYFATGDQKGIIRLWYCLNEQLSVKTIGIGKRSQTTNLHWHSHAVSSLSFSSNGAYLLSGGEEAVLVVWHVETGKKEFVPRLGSPISTVSLSKDGNGVEVYLIGLVDSTYLFVNPSTLKVSRSFSRIKLDWSTSSEDRKTTEGRAPLAVHATTSTLLLPSSHPSSLQIYSPASSKLVSELEVSPSNRVSRRDEKPLEPSHVDESVISPSGEWMITVDSREGDETFHGEMHLKVWQWDRNSRTWDLNTRIDRPHIGRIVSIAFSSSSDHFITAGKDGAIKTWGLKSTGTLEVFWTTRSIITHPASSVHHVSWSPDGSLVSVSVSNRVAIYDPATTFLCRNITIPECKSVSSSHFLGDGGRYLVISGAQDIILWDLIYQGVHWHHRCDRYIESVVPHEKSDIFCIFFQTSMPEDDAKTHIAVFSPLSPTPSRQLHIPFKLRNVAPYTSPTTTHAFTFVGITKSWAVILFGDEVHHTNEANSSTISRWTPQKRSLFQDIFGQSVFSRSENEREVASAIVPEKRESIFTKPSHLLPPLENMFDNLMEGLLTVRVNDSDVDGDGPDDDMAMDIDEETDSVIVAVQPNNLVEPQELDKLVQLFLTHSVKTPATVSSKVDGVNGHSKINGTSHPLQNGVKRPSTRSKTIVAPPSPAPVVSTSSSPVVNGKKRKKSQAI